MTDIRFHDISYAQGAYNMDTDPNPIIFMRMSYFGYGDKKGHYDDQASSNYNNAIRTGKLPGLYHFAGGGDPRTEAEFFVAACSPLANGDLLILDYELTASMSPPADPSAWCLAFVERVKELTGKYPLFYTYYAMLKQYGFAEVLKRCGLWVAHYGVAPEDNIPNCPNYIIHQFQGSPIDTNACFIPLETLRKYAFEANVPQPEPVTPPATPVPDPVVTPTPEPTPDPTPDPVVDPPKPTEPEIITGPTEPEAPANDSVLSAVVVRALWTFVEAFGGSLILGVTATGFTFSKVTLIALVTGALAAGISAAKNVIVQAREAK